MPRRHKKCHVPKATIGTDCPHGKNSVAAGDENSGLLNLSGSHHDLRRVAAPRVDTGPYGERPKSIRRHHNDRSGSVIALVPSVSRQSLSWLRRCIGAFLRSDAGVSARWWLAGLLLCLLLINAMNVLNSFVLRDFMSAIQNRDGTRFQALAWVYAAVFGISTVIAVSQRFAEERLGLLWRHWMTRSLTSVYVDGKIYLQWQADKALTNPDQRISEDAGALAFTTLSLALMISNSTIAAISFSGVLWAISPTLFFVAIVYAVIGSGVTALLGKPLVQLNYQQADFEANFRGELVHLRQFGDAIALAGYEERSRARLLDRVDGLVANYRKIISVNRNVGVFTTGYNYLIQLVPILIAAPLFMRGDADFGVVGQSAMAFSTLVTALSLIVTQIQSISAYAAVLRRLGEFSSKAAHAMERRTTGCIGCKSEPDRFVFSDLTLQTSLDDGDVLIRDLDLTIEKGANLLISGPRAAQHALFRAAAGMPIVGSGEVILPPSDKVASLPESPFLPFGTLRDVLRSQDESATTDAEIRSVLSQLGLSVAIPANATSDETRNWHDLLTLKEEQLLAVARVILSRPDFALVDHLESSFDQATERRVLRLMKRRGITCISFSSQLPDTACHDQCLELGDDGKWQLTDAATQLAAQQAD